ncbi:MAG: hypothetical protein U0350_48085 [Caldilineaceae bacterium]
MSAPILSTKVLIVTKIKLWLNRNWQKLVKWYDGLPSAEWRRKLLQWVYYPIGLIRQSHAFQLAAILYVLISMLQACYQNSYAPTAQMKLLNFSNQDFVLCVRYPSYLTQDGETRQGPISLRMLPTSAKAKCLEPLGWVTWFTSLWAYLPLTLPSTSAPALMPTQTQTMTSTALIGTVSAAPSSKSLARPTSTPTQAATIPATPTVTRTLSSPATFNFDASADLLFIDPKGASYSPIITLTIWSEKSITLAHARLQYSPTQGTFSVKHAESNTEAESAPTVALEGTGISLSSLWLRKFLNILLAPTAGALLALAAIGLDEFRKRDDKKHEEEKERIQIICKGILQKLENQSDVDVLSVIQNWLDKFGQISIDAKNDPKSQQILNDAWQKCIEKFIEYTKKRLPEFGNIESKEYKLLLKLDGLRLTESSILEDTPHEFDDLVFVTSFLFSSTTLRSHTFIDPELMGCYVNLIWLEPTQRDTAAQALITLQQKSQNIEQFYQEVLNGMFTAQKLREDKDYSERNSRNLPLTSATLLEELDDPSSPQEFYNTYSPCWQDLKTMLEVADKNTNQVLSKWLTDRQARRAKERKYTEMRLLFSRDLWPLERPTNALSLNNDANYNFPKVYDERDVKGTAPVYKLHITSSPVEIQASAFDVCMQYLSYLQHHIVTGQHQAGKTWLRLYLEWYILNTDSATLPVFYFAPASLAYLVNPLELARAMATSIANQIFANLLERSSRWGANRDQLIATGSAIAKFLNFYGYNVPLSNRSLAQPIPGDALLNIEKAYGSGYLSGVYAEMKQEIERTSSTPMMSLSNSVESMLDDIQRATEVAAYKNIVLLIDNWGDLPEPVLHRLLLSILNADLLVQLQQHNIFLKVFVPSIDIQTRNHLQKCCEIDRLHNDSQSQLSLYTYS